MCKKILPDLVLLDLNMTHIDDFQVMEQLREAEKGFYAPILVLTTQSDQISGLMLLRLRLVILSKNLLTLLRSSLEFPICWKSDCLIIRFEIKTRFWRKKSRQEPAHILKVYRPKGDTNPA
jgi:CheY-like chemotaxis protein